MAQNTGGDKTEPSLELPSLKLPGLGRRRKRSEPHPPPEPTTAVDGPTEPEPTPPVEERAEPEPSRAVTREERTEPEPAPEVEDRTEQLPPAVAHDDRTEQFAPVEGRPSEAPQQRWEQDPAATTAPLAPAPTRAPAGASVARRAEAPSERPAAAAAEPIEHERPSRRGFSLPALPGPAAAAVTGVVIGIAGAVATFLALAGCELVRGVGSCGGAPGFFILLAILVLLVLLGSALLAGFKVLHPGSTSFLAVGIVTVMVMLFLLDYVASAWMIPVVIALFAAAYLVAHWVSTRFADEDTGRRDWR